MQKRIHIIDAIIYRILGYLFIFAFVMNLSELLWYRFSLVDILLWTLLFYTIVCLITWNKWTVLVFFSAALLALIIFVLWARRMEYLSFYIYRVQSVADVYVNSVIRGRGLQRIYQPNVLKAVIVLVGIVFNTLAIRFRAMGFLTLLTVVLFALNNEFGTLQSQYLIIAVLGVQMLIYFMNMMKKGKQSKFYTQATSAVVFTLIFVMLSYGLGLAISDPLGFMEEYSDSTVIQRRSTETEKRMVFYPAERLVDGVHNGDTVVMRVTSDADVYLRGVVLDDFDGLTWRDTYSDTFGTYVTGEIPYSDVGSRGIAGFLPFILEENMMALGHGDYFNVRLTQFPEALNAYYANMQVDVIYENMYTDVMFMPMNTISIMGNGVAYSQDYTDIIKSDEIIEEGTAFNVTYVLPLYNSDVVNGVLIGTDESHLEELTYAIDSEETDALSVDVGSRQLRYTDDYLSNLLLLPESMTDRTVQLADDITSDYDNDYDKAKAIEQFLKSNYSYNQVNLTLPETGGDFVDYFLFESTEGYCSYFASAMAVMLRSEGIPARVVKGYVAKTSNSSVGGDVATNPVTGQLEVYHSEIYVRDKDAHTWVEAWIDGFGFVPFEPTSGYDFAETVVGTTLHAYEPDEAIIPQQLKPTETVVQPVEEGISAVVVVLAWTFGIILLIATGFFTGRYFYRKRMNSLTYDQRVKFQHGLVLWMLKYLFRSKEDHETLKMYYGALEKKSAFSHMAFDQYYNMLEKCYYSSLTMSEDDFMNSETMIKGIRDIFKVKYRFKHLYFTIRYQGYI